MTSFRLNGAAAFMAANVAFALTAALPAMADATHGRLPTLGFERSPFSGGVLMSRAVRTGVVKLPIAPRVSQQPVLNCKPAPCTLRNVQASEGGQPVNETPISIDPNNANHVLTAANDFNCTASVQGYFASTDGGKTFHHSCAPAAAGAVAGDGDPIVGWDLDDVAYRGGIEELSDTLALVVSKSTDFGQTWSAPLVVQAMSGIYMDKPWMEIDTNVHSPRKNTIYVSITEIYARGGTQVAVLHSTDRGARWQIVNVGTLQNSGNFDSFTDVAIGDDGTVYLTWQRCPLNGPKGDCGDTTATMYFSKSADGGKTWTAEAPIHTAHLAPDTCGSLWGCLPNTGERIINIPVVAIDSSSSANHGRLYVMDYNWTGTFMQERVTSSGDGGASWGPPVRVAPRTDKHDQFFQWLSVNAKGVVGATWLDRRLDPNNVNYDAFAAISTDGGATFGTSVRLSKISSNPFNDGFDGKFLGDYAGNVWDAGKQKLFTSWPDTRNGTNAQDEIGGLKP